MYYLRIDGTNYPVAPESFSETLESGNTTVTLINEQEVNLLKTRKLSSYSFDVRLPREEYSWAYYVQGSGASLESGFNPPENYIELLRALREEKKTFEIMLVRGAEGGNVDSFVQEVTLESMTINEDAADGSDITVNCSFKEWVDFTTTVTSGTTTTTQSTTLKPKQTSYTVKKNDTLKSISKKMYGVQKYSTNIYKWNKTKIEKAAKNHGKKSSSSGKYIYKGTKLTLKTITK